MATVSIRDAFYSRKRAAPAKRFSPRVIVFILASLLFAHAQEQKCGDKADAPRILTAGIAGWDHPVICVQLLGIQKQGDLPRMTVSFNDNIYSSTDRGQTWHLVKRAASYFDYTVSNADTKMLYRYSRNGQHESDLDISHDGGRSWRIIHPKTATGRHLGRIWIIGTSARDPGRVYANASAVGEHGLYVSDNFGRAFRLLGIGNHVAENRANPDILYLLMQDGIMVSRDRGAGWKLLNNNKALFSPSFINNLGQLQPWKEDSEDREVGCLSKIDQTIESDPKDPKIIYVLRDKGLYRSSDAGRAFLLLPLAKDKLCDIRSVVVDPIDGRYIFAAVGAQCIFKSSDFGCSWRELALPKQ